MNLLDASEYTGEKGIYAAAYLEPLFVPQVDRLCEDLGLEKPDPKDLHCTLMYSRDRVVEKMPRFQAPINAAICSVQHWVGHNGKTYVVADLQSMGLCGAHTKFHNAGAKHSFPAFRPHITLGKVDEVSEDFQTKIDELNWKLKGKPIHVVFTDLRANDINPDY